MKIKTLETQIEEVISKRKELAKLLPSFEDDAILTMAMLEVLKQTDSPVAPVEKVVDHAQFIEGAKETVIPAKDRRNYNPKVLRKMRMDKGLTQANVESHFGWGWSTVFNIENGRRANLPNEIKTQLISLYQS